MLRLLLLVLVVRPALMEVFTSIGHMSELLDTESDLLRSLDSYIAEQQRRLHSLRAWAESIQEVRRSATLDPEGFLGNPVNAYRLLKRLGQQWRPLDDTAIMNPATEFLANISAQRLWLPTEEGVTGAAKALMRLQDTYRLSTRDIADGNLPGAMYRDALSARDCYDLGRVAYTEGNYRHTQLWMRQALRMMHRGGGGERRGAEGGEAEETPGGGGSAVEGVEWLTGATVVDEVGVLDHLSFVAFQQGKTEEAYSLTKRLLMLDPSHERAQGNFDYFSRALSAKRKGDDESHLLTTGMLSDSSSSSSSSSSSKRRRKDTMGGERLGEEEVEEENPRLLDDVSFHPCVRFKRWESERVLSFIPPDGNFRLISYHVSSQSLVSVPVCVRHSVSFREGGGGGGRLELTLGPRHSGGKTLEAVVVTATLPPPVLAVALTATQGTHAFDPVSKVLTWDIGKINPQKLPTIKGSLTLQSGAPNPEENPVINVHFKIQQFAISGLKVNRLDLYGEKYKPFKGVKYLTKAGRFQVRT
ncbi:unnamed protein product [Lampetra planeri]